MPGAACLVPAGRTGGGDGSAPRAVGALVLPPNQRLERTGEAMGGSMQEPAAAAQPQVVRRAPMTRLCGPPWSRGQEELQSSLRKRETHDDLVGGHGEYRGYGQT